MGVRIWSKEDQRKIHISSEASVEIRVSKKRRLKMLIIMIKKKMPTMIFQKIKRYRGRDLKSKKNSNLWQQNKETKSRLGKMWPNLSKFWSITYGNIKLWSSKPFHSTPQRMSFKTTLRPWTLALNNYRSKIQSKRVVVGGSLMDHRRKAYLKWGPVTKKVRQSHWEILLKG